MNLTRWGYHNGTYQAEVIYIIIDRVLYIHFLGSNHWRDWIENFQVCKTVGPYGFHARWANYAAHVYKKFRDEDIVRIVATGHSAGGAEAVYFCFKFLDRKDIPSQVTMYNAPTAAKRENDLYSFQRFHLTHIRNHTDFVSRAPLLWDRCENEQTRCGSWNPIRAHSEIEMEMAWERRVA